VGLVKTVPIGLRRVLEYQLGVPLGEEPVHRTLPRTAMRIVVAVGVVAVVIGVVLYAKSAVHYGIGSIKKPGGGMYPLIAVSILALGLVGMAVEAVRGTLVPPLAEDEKAADLAGAFRASAVVVLAVIYILVTPTIGDQLSGVLFAVLVLFVMGNRLWLTLVGGILLGLGAHALFVGVLALPLGHGSGI
jgi:hypothetical protein